MLQAHSGTQARSVEHLAAFRSHVNALRHQRIQNTPCNQVKTRYDLPVFKTLTSIERTLKSSGDERVAEWRRKGGLLGLER